MKSKIKQESDMKKTKLELNHYLKSELRNYVPEHHMFQENNNQEDTDGPNTEE